MKTNYSLTILLLFALAVTQSVYSQLNYITPSGTSNNTGTYTDLGTNGSVITTANFDNANSAPQNIGFTFSYDGSTFTQFVLNTNGFIKLGNTNPSIDSLFFTSGISGGVFNSTNPADIDILSIFNLDLQAGTATPEYRVFTSGSPGSQICTIQFKNVRGKIAPIQFDNMEFQIKLYETTNTIEFIYGTWIPSPGSSSTKMAAIGLKGANSSQHEILTVTKTSFSEWSGAGFIPGNYSSVGFNYGKPTRPLPDPGRTFRFNQAHQKDAEVYLFTLGSIPDPYGAPRIDSAVIRNIGMDTLKNITVTLNITGANTFTDNKTILSLASGATQTIGFNAYDPTFLGTNTVSVSVPNDDNNVNNIATYSQIVNNTIFSYADAAKATGAIAGQNYPGYLATKYTITGTTSVTGANIYIANNAASIGKNVYAILFDDAGNKLDSSSTFTITVADTGKYHTFTLPLAPGFSNASFYIGLAQPDTGYYALGYQDETGPVRLDAYFIRSMNTSTFSDLGGINSYNPYRFMIQAIVSNTTGILQKAGENTVTVYPNPFSDETTFNIVTNDVKDVSLYLYDIAGRVVKTLKNITTPQFKVEKDNLQSGIYFYKLYDKGNIMDSGKLIIE